MRDLNIPNATQLHRRYFKRKSGRDILSRQAIYVLCNRPKMIEIQMVTKVCNALGLSPADLWRADKRNRVLIMESLNKSLAILTVNRYACSICWGDLEMHNDLSNNSMVFVVCKKCQDETRGYVTKYFVNRRRGESEFEKINVTHLMRKLGYIENPLKNVSRESIMKSLGY